MLSEGNISTPRGLVTSDSERFHNLPTLYGSAKSAFLL
jgi:hypothetical protein